MFNIIKKNNRNYRKNIKKDYDNLLRLYQSDLAHQEMVIKAGGGVENLIDTIDIQNEDIELMKIKILSLMKENILIEKKLIKLATTYKFKFSGINLEINKERLKDTIKNFIIYKKSKIIFKIFRTNLLNLNNKLNIRSKIDLISIFFLPLKIPFYIFKKNMKILYSLRYIIYFLNLIFLLKSI